MTDSQAGAPAPLVSVIIANYNYAEFLAQAVTSALGQTYPAIEVVVVDDGSKDESVSVARVFPVRLVEQAHSGVAGARNRGVAEARGDLIVFLDADDALEPTFVERCWESLRRRGPEVAYAYPQMVRFGRETGLFPSREFNGRALFDGNFVPISTLLRRAAFDAVGGFDPTWPAHEDHDLWVRLFVRGYTATFVPEPLLRCRFHGASRNSLTDRQREALHVRLVLEHLRYGWRWIVRNPRTMLRTLLRR